MNHLGLLLASWHNRWQPWPGGLGTDSQARRPAAYDHAWFTVFIGCFSILFAFFAIQAIINIFLNKVFSIYHILAFIIDLWGNPLILNYVPKCFGLIIFEELHLYQFQSAIKRIILRKVKNNSTPEMHNLFSFEKAVLSITKN